MIAICYRHGTRYFTMKLYILHSVIVDADGNVSFDCCSPYRSLSAAKKAQRKLVNQYKEGWQFRHLTLQEEQYGRFIRVSVLENAEEIQSNIVVFDVEIPVDEEAGK